ncbi:hypothetical protein HZS_6876, partial [Henneguya salminicola]
MNCHQQNAYTDSQYKSFSDSENTGGYFDNGDSELDNPLKPPVLIYCSEENMINNCAESFINSTFSYPSMKVLNNCSSCSKPDQTSNNSFDTIPKAFIERSIRPEKLDINEKKKHLAELIAQIESDNSENSNPATAPNEKITKDNVEETKNIIIPEILDPPPQSDPVLNKIIPPKRTHAVDPYTSEDSNVSFFDDPSITFNNYTHPSYFFPSSSLNFSDKSLGFNSSFDTNHSYPYHSTGTFPAPAHVSYNPSDFMFSNSCPAYFVSDSNKVPKPKFSKCLLDSGITVTKYPQIDEVVPLKQNETTILKELPHLVERDLSCIEMAKDQHGSRLIQQKIENATPIEISEMISELTLDVENLVLLVGDVFGNYVIQKLFDYGNEDHRMAILIKIKGNVLHLAVQMYGCRVIQKAIECGSKKIQKVIIHELKDHVLDCIKDQNGNHVIQKCIEKIHPKRLNFIINEITGRVVELSTHPYGCRVIQRILEFFEACQKMSIATELLDEIPSLVLDQYGNYVVQHILDYCLDSSHRAYVFKYVQHNLFLLSSHKFASNVVEKCLISGSKEERGELMMEIINNSVGTEDDIVYKMMKDAYANYVIQKMIDVIVADKEHDLFNSLVNKIRLHYNSLRKITYGKHIINKIDKIYTRMSIKSPTVSKFQQNGDSISLSDKSYNYCIENGTLKPKVSSGDYKNNTNQRQVICDSLTEFPSLIDGNN